MKKNLFNHFPDNREQGKTNIEQTQIVLLRMMKIFNQICEENDINYWLDYGTLLGAIRHKGFIPWDAEMDIGMLRADFEAFKKIGANKLPEDIFFQIPEVDPGFRPWSNWVDGKLRDKYSHYPKISKKYPDYTWHNGLQIDIFVYDQDYDVPYAISNQFERNIKKNTELHLKQEEIEYLELVPFEDTEFPVPTGYDSYLKRNYGDYMSYPSKEEQIPEDVEIFTPCNHTEVLHWENRKS